MIKELTWEICKCLKDGYYMAALTSALTLPDICGRAKYPEMVKQTKQRYIQWFDEYIGQYEKSTDEDHGMPYLSGKLVYSLRCSIMHQGNPNIECKKLNIDYFELLYREIEGVSVCTSSSEARIIDVDGEEVATNIKYCVNVRMLCWKICKLATYYFNKHKEQFDFFNYNLVDCGFSTRKLFRMKT